MPNWINHAENNKNYDMFGGPNTESMDKAKEKGLLNSNMEFMDPVWVWKNSMAGTLQ